VSSGARAGLFFAGLVIVATWACVAALLLAVVYGDAGAETPTPLGASSCLAHSAERDPSFGQLDVEQLRNSAAIVEVGQRLGVAPYGWTIALATAMQESGLRNLTWGDRDSLGLFQQRPSQGWGSAAQILDPVYAAGRFYRGLLDVPGWRDMPLTAAAQAVQRSAFPFAYARHEQLAATLVQRLTHEDPGACRELSPGEWTLPLTTVYRLTSPFGPRIHPIRGTADFHTGLDFAAAAGTAVHAVSAGTVARAGWAGGYGNLVVLRHGDGLASWYAHLSRVDASPGQQLPAGTVIGAVGSTGNATGPHLHLEVRLDGSPVDPEQWLVAKGFDPRP
jgi:hypothetical protein